jgi:hypothetical protein
MKRRAGAADRRLDEGDNGIAHGFTLDGGQPFYLPGRQ